MESEHYFTGHTNARLTFMIGIIIGMMIMTAGGLAFFTYLYSGGEIKSYAIAPLDTDSQILTEPIKTVSSDDEIAIQPSTPNHSFGAQENYKTTLVYYADYECRFCKKFFPEVLAVVNAHSDSIRLIMKHYPLVQIHPNAKSASVAAYCAGEQGKLLEYSEQLYNRQDQLGNDDLYTTIASELQIDQEAFKSCRNLDEVSQQIEADAQEAMLIGIQTQPNLLIMHENGDQQLIDGYVNQSYLEGVLSF